MGTSLLIQTSACWEKKKKRLRRHNGCAVHSSQRNLIGYVEGDLRKGGCAGLSGRIIDIFLYESFSVWCKGENGKGWVIQNDTSHSVHIRVTEQVIGLAWPV